MIYLVEIEGQKELRVELSEVRRGVWKARVGDHEVRELEFRGRTDDGAYLMLINGKSRKFHLNKNCTKHLLDDGQRVSRIQVDPAGDIVLEHARRANTGPKHLSDRLESSITGIVLEVLVEPGQRVKAGQPVIVIEAMKMENTLRATQHAQVSSVHIEAGQSVSVGDELVRFRPLQSLSEPGHHR